MGVNEGKKIKGLFSGSLLTPLKFTGWGPLSFLTVVKGLIT